MWAFVFVGGEIYHEGGGGECLTPKMNEMLFAIDVDTSCLEIYANGLHLVHRKIAVRELHQHA